MVRHLRRTGLGAAMLLAGGAVLIGGPVAALGQPAGGYAGSETCLECHEEAWESIAHSVHGTLKSYDYPGEAEGCESCHGPGAAHAESEDPGDILVMTAELGNDGVATCLDCHKTGVTLDWEMSVHAQSEVACLSCHEVHQSGASRALLKDQQDQLCYECHLDARAAFHLPSHHPLREGFMTCASCHQVHGKRFQGTATGETAREACLVCHAQYAGPHIFEHSPVTEDCAICHHPHGAVADNLLHQNEPFICLQCHQPHFHTILAGLEGDYGVDSRVSDVDEGYAGLSGTSHYDSMKRSMLTKCTQCHQSVHGTDEPSQGITGQGRALNR